MTEEKFAMMELGFIDKINPNENYEYIGETIEDMGELFITERDYAYKVGVLADRLFGQLNRESKVEYKIIHLKQNIFRIKEFAQSLLANNKMEYKYAAATDKIVRFNLEEHFEKGYKMSLKVERDTLKLFVTENGENYNGKVSLKVKSLEYEEEIEFEVINGELELEMVKKEDAIKSDSIDAYFIIN